MLRCGSILAAWLCLANLAVAAEAPTVAEKSDRHSQDARIAKWVADLGSEEYATRKRAIEALVDAGAPAVEGVTQAADTDDLELPRRCIGILRDMLHSGDETTKTAAKAALEQLTRSDRKFLADKAAEALKAPAPAAGPAGPIGVRIRIGGQVIVGGGQRIQISSKVTNGKREVTAEIGPKKIHITDDNGRNIVVQVTEPVEDANGNTAPQTKEYKADDLDDLKQKHPEAAQLYQQFGGGIRPVGGALRVGEVKLPAQIRRNHIDMLKRHLENIEKLVERQEDRVDAGELPEEHFERLHQSLDAHKQRLQKRIEELEEKDPTPKP